MVRQRKRMFGPLLYSTLLLGAFAAGYSALVVYGPALRDQWNQRLLVNQAHSGDPKAREEALNSLVARGAGVAMPHVTAATHDPNINVRIAAWRHLIELTRDPAVVIPVLSSGSNDPDPHARQAAAYGFVHLADVTEGMTRTRVTGAGWNANRRVESRKIVQRLLSDPNISVRISAAGALAKLGADPSSTTALEAAATDLDWDIRFAAASALLKLNGKADVTAVRTLLEFVALPGVIPERGAALETLKGISDQAFDQAVAALALRLSDADSAVRYDIIGCLAAAGTRARRALPVIEKLAQDPDPDVRKAAMTAIVSIEGPQSARGRAVLLKVISDPTLASEQRQTALITFREANPSALPTVTPRLISQLADPNPTVRLAAFELLSYIVPDAPAQIPAVTEEPSARTSTPRPSVSPKSP